MKNRAKNNIKNLIREISKFKKFKIQIPFLSDVEMFYQTLDSKDLVLEERQKDKRTERKIERERIQLTQKFLQKF
jgi:hypothetical protein